MSGIVIHGVPGSPFVRMVQIACEEKGVPYRIAALGFGQNREPAYLARQPFGKIPAIEHGDFELYETQAIVRYVDEAFEGPALQPVEPKARARMSQVLNILDWYVTPSLTSGIGFNRIVAPIFGRPANEEAVAAAIPLARTAIQALEPLLGDQPYFGGAAPTLADFCAIAHLELGPRSPEGAALLAGSPLLAWIERMQARPSVRNTEMRRMMGLETA